MNPETYLATLRRQAAENARVAYELGLTLLYGTADNTPDPAEAALWLSRARHAGISISTNAYEDLISHGYRLLSADECRTWRRGIGRFNTAETNADDLPSFAPEDIFANCRREADHDPQAAFFLGDMYDRGYGCAADADQALYWYTRAMRGGHVEAAQRLATHYRDSNRPREAEAAYRVLAQNGDVNAQVQLFLWHRADNPKPAPLSPPSAEEQYARCRAAAENGDVNGQALLAHMLINGYGCEANPDEAAIWLKKAVDAKQPLACFLLGEMLWDSNPQQAHALVRYAAQSGIHDAMRRLLLLHLHTNGFGKNVTELNPYLALNWAERLMEHGQTDVMLFLANFWLQGTAPVTRQPYKAHEMLVRFVRTASPEELSKVSPALVLRIGTSLMHAGYYNTCAIWFNLVARKEVKHTTEEHRKEASYKLDESVRGSNDHPSDPPPGHVRKLYDELRALFLRV